MKNKRTYVSPKPAYAIDSVDHALRLALLLQQEGSVRVTDAATRLGVSRSTAHRLLAMLVYRGFAEQAEDRLYHAGEALRPAELSSAPVGVLRQLARPHMQNLTNAVKESSNLTVLAGAEARFVLTIESEQVLRVGDRGGRALPAHLASGGKVLLAGLPRERLTEMYSRTPSVDMTSMTREINLVRKRGFAINNQSTEPGVTAISVPVRDAEGSSIAALGIALPSVRFKRDELPHWVGALSACAESVGEDLARATRDEE